MIRRAAVTLGLTCLSVFATEAMADPRLPALYDMTTVSSDGDALQIRKAPTADAPVIGHISFDRAGIEVVAFSNGATWGQVNFGERSGWVPMHALSARDDAHLFPSTFACYGTEPFWQLTVTQNDGASLRTPLGETKLPATALMGSANRIDRHLLPLGDAAGAVISQTLCSDGMSDRAYGLSAEVIFLDKPMILSGCCSIAP